MGYPFLFGTPGHSLRGCHVLRPRLEEGRHSPLRRTPQLTAVRKEGAMVSRRSWVGTFSLCLNQLARRTRRSRGVRVGTRIVSSSRESEVLKARHEMMSSWDVPMSMFVRHTASRATDKNSP